MKKLFIINLIASLFSCNMKYEFKGDQKKYIGYWENENAKINISKNGYVEYEIVKNGLTKSVNAPIVRFQGENFVVGAFSIETTFVVDTPPHQAASDQFKMTVDGNDYYLTKRVNK